MRQKIERVLNLVALLLDTPRPLPAEEIRGKIHGYEGQSDDAFRRMFERDKEELREMGIPIERVTAGAWEEGYRIPRDALLEDPGLTPAEAAALSLAALAWAGQVGGASPAVAMLKLSLGASPEAHPWILPRLEAPDPNFEVFFEGIARRKIVTFAYRRGGGEPPAERTVEPAHLVHRGAWYVSGRDRDRGEVRRFKLSRIAGRAHLSPGDGPDFERLGRDQVEPFRAPWEGDAEDSARVAFEPSAVWWVERRTGAKRVGERSDGWVELSLPVADRGQFVSWVLGFANDAVVLEPAGLRSEVVGRLKDLAGGGQ